MGQVLAKKKTKNRTRKFECKEEYFTKNGGVLLQKRDCRDSANVAHSVSITPGKTENQKFPVYGTPEYIDPEYMETREVTEKWDVYSFGVLMLELLTGKDPSEMARCGRNLVVEFVSRIERDGDFEEMIDNNVLEEGNMVEIQRFAQLALKCVANKGEERPSMVSVVEELWELYTR